MVSIIGLCGSLRNGSFNRKLLEATVELSPPGMTIEPESITAIPLYDADVEEQGGGGHGAGGRKSQTTNHKSQITRPNGLCG